MVVEPCLVGGHLFESHCMFFFLNLLSPKENFLLSITIFFHNLYLFSFYSQPLFSPNMKVAKLDHSHLTFQRDIQNIKI